ncbi:GNAT family N-acetyltransferase [Georgenia sp. MJ170]|uniref:GNAT family N-acetyltransferase n=1 Tax=Georgenia sunbinii TaxID=3117728 RepID=UPI002F268203
MVIELGAPTVDGLGEALDALQAWQDDATPLQLHPGDVGWYWRWGAAATAAAVRTWRRGGEVVAVGLLDGPTLLRLGIAPDAQDDEELARHLADDVTRPERGVLPGGAVTVEAPTGALVKDVLTERGWTADEPWTPLRHDLIAPFPAPGVHVEVVGLAQMRDRTMVQRASFGASSFTDERWHAMAAGPLYADGRCLVARDDDGAAAAAITVWSAGPGQPGLIEPLGVHPEHRGRGFGTAITVAAAATLQELGASSVLVCTPTSNVGAVATYLAAGFEPLPERYDRRRDG